MLRLLVTVFAVFVFVPASQAQNNTDAILILDASGAMWGQVDGRTKISAARSAVDTILSKWKPNDPLGLIAYGHRSKGLSTGNGKAIQIFGAERDINNERTLFHTSYDPDLNLALNAGNYVAVVEYDGDRKVEQPFTVTAGKRVEVKARP